MSDLVVRLRNLRQITKSRDNRNHTRQTTLQLFQDRDRERDIVAEIGPATPRNRAWASSFLPSYTPQLFVTSPIAIRTVPVPPNAPIKPRKSFPKEGLKPKKLHFTDNETEKENSSQKSTQLSKQQDQSNQSYNRDSLSNVLQNLRLELDNKENMRYGLGRHERKMKNNRSVAKERVKNHYDSSQSSKLNSCEKSEFVYFRI
ncbi:PREDICTED: uncharacterized protein LOC105560114 [Vollenhovia emeryi]|uniref:uncharacterized protein LOC105560114 n=1 Tax=Vollenhovia emeryi TaxID=411798 RepID=UPI0005F40F2F|nr:PREDICTED: uncharacterized protein LOC105560114 [Vollenhovia emeryi]